MLSLIIFTACSASPVPPEVVDSERQEQHLWRLEAQKYFPEEYAQYKADFHKARQNLIRENSRFRPLRNYTGVQSSFRNVLMQGEQLIALLEKERLALSVNIPLQVQSLQKRINTLRGLTDMINEGRLARSNLVRADIIILEAQKKFEQDNFKGARDKLADAAKYLDSAEQKLTPIFGRYGDHDQVAQWQQWANDTIFESKKRNNLAIIVNKSRKSLILYKNGNPWKVYQIGLGRNGTRDKVRAGDHATPEGKYKVIEKIPKSRYRKALLINYPNEEDRKQFLLAKRKGIVPKQAGIGGLIEIHGGGRDSMTYGCVSMDNSSIDELYRLVHIGTPVTIVGAVQLPNRISAATQGL